MAVKSELGPALGCAAVTNDFLIPPFSFFHDGDGLCCSWFYFFFLHFPQLTLEKLWFCGGGFSLPTCSLIHGFASNGRGVGSI
jgi:hypothetical protein